MLQDAVAEATGVALEHAYTARGLLLSLVDRVPLDDDALRALVADVVEVVLGQHLAPPEVLQLVDRQRQWLAGELDDEAFADLVAEALAAVDEGRPDGEWLWRGERCAVRYWRRRPRDEDERRLRALIRTLAVRRQRGARRVVRRALETALRHSTGSRHERAARLLPVVVRAVIC